MNIYVDASYSPPHKVAIVAWGISPEEIYIETIRCNGVAIAEKHALQRAIEHATRLGLTATIYSDHQASSKIELPQGFNLIWIKGHDRTSNKVTEEQKMFSIIDRRARRELRALVKTM